MESACRTSRKPSLSASKVTYLDIEESTSSEYQRVFAEFAQHPPDAIIVSSTSKFFPYRQLIVEPAEKAACRVCMPGAITWRWVGWWPVYCYIALVDDIRSR
jgi:hypothetical protein